MTVPLRLAPGPLTTSTGVKVVMARDWGSRHRESIQGSGRFAIEATSATFVPRGTKILLLVNVSTDAHFVFEEFYDRLSARGSLVYAGKLAVADSSRVGCFG